MVILVSATEIDFLLNIVDICAYNSSFPGLDESTSPITIVLDSISSKGKSTNPELIYDSENNKIDIRYRATRVIWKYDPAIGLYRRSADGQGHFDANTMEQITAANVVVIYADHQFTDILESEFQNNKSYSIQINLMGAGDAILFRDGQQYNGKWVRNEKDAIIGLRTTSGDILPLKPGQTWFQIVQLPSQQNPQEEWIKMEW